MKLKARVAVITGASSGIGAAIALRFAHEGATVVLAARNVAALEAIAETIRAEGGTAFVRPTDVRDETQCQALIEQTVRDCGRVDILINNAGLGYSNPVGQLHATEVREQIDVDLLGVIWCCNAVVPVMRRQRSGHIITIGSVASRVGLPTSTVYCAAKYGLVGFSQGMAAEVARDNIKVSLLHPGYVNTDFNRRAARGKTDKRPRPGPAMGAAYVAGVALKLLEKPRREVVVTWPYRIITGLNRFAPGLTNVLLRGAARMYLRKYRTN